MLVCMLVLLVGSAAAESDPGPDAAAVHLAAAPYGAAAYAPVAAHAPYCANGGYVTLPLFDLVINNNI